MLQGDRITLRPILEAHLEAAYAAHMNIANRGAFFPVGVVSEPSFRKAFAEHGYWQRDEGTLLIVARHGKIAGHIEFYKPVAYWDAFELSYQLYEERFAGKGYASQAVQLLVDYLRREEAEPDPARDRSRQRGIAPSGRKVRLHARRDGARRLLQRGSQPGRPRVLAPARRPAPVARGTDVARAGRHPDGDGGGPTPPGRENRQETVGRQAAMDSGIGSSAGTPGVSSSASAAPSLPATPAAASRRSADDSAA